jgi:hypothetical protein
MHKRPFVHRMPKQLLSDPARDSLTRTTQRFARVWLDVSLKSSSTLGWLVPVLIAGFSLAESKLCDINAVVIVAAAPIKATTIGTRTVVEFFSANFELLTY